MLLVAMLLVLLGVPARALGQATTVVVNGTVTAPNYKALGGSARLIAYLYETPQGGTRRQVATSPAATIGTRVPPFTYEIRTTAAINKNSAYDVEVVLAEGAAVRYRGQARIANFNANPTVANVVVNPASGSLPNTGSGAQILLVALVAAALAAGVSIWRRRLVS
jgi:LPXTG-motif cell wall-anchored protein